MFGEDPAEAAEYYSAQKDTTMTDARPEDTCRYCRKAYTEPGVFGICADAHAKKSGLCPDCRQPKSQPGARGICSTWHEPELPSGDALDRATKLLSKYGYSYTVTGRLLEEIAGLIDRADAAGDPPADLQSVADRRAAHIAEQDAIIRRRNARITALEADLDAAEAVKADQRRRIADLEVAQGIRTQEIRRLNGIIADDERRLMSAADELATQHPRLLENVSREELLDELETRLIDGESARKTLEANR
jgi:uncharacterized coiled-coil protein SlyX